VHKEKDELALAREAPRERLTACLLGLRKQALLEHALLTQRRRVWWCARAIWAGRARVILRKHPVAIRVEDEKSGHGVQREIGHLVEKD
jgi:hypothetical protein